MAATTIDEQGLDQMHDSFVLAGKKVEKSPKDESPSEMFARIRTAKELKSNKKAKAGAKKLVKKKVIKKMTLYFPKK
jgi:hypothetical protein